MARWPPELERAREPRLHHLHRPLLGIAVSRHRGHVTVLKSPGQGGGHASVPCIAAGGGGSGGSSRAKDHNSSRSNQSG